MQRVLGIRPIEGVCSNNISRESKEVDSQLNAASLSLLTPKGVAQCVASFVDPGFNVEYSPFGEEPTDSRAAGAMHPVVDGSEDYAFSQKSPRTEGREHILPWGVPVMCAAGGYLSRAPSFALQYSWSYHS